MWLVPILIAVALVGCGDDASTGVSSTATTELATRQRRSILLRRYPLPP